MQRKAEDLCMQLAGVRDGGPRSGTRRAACGQQEQLLGGGCASPGLDLPCCGVHPVLSLALEGHKPYGGTVNTADIPPPPKPRRPPAPHAVLSRPVGDALLPRFPKLAPQPRLPHPLRPALNKVWAFPAQGMRRPPGPGCSGSSPG